MASYTTIRGYIEDIYEAETDKGKSYLGIRFYTNDPHDNDTGYHDINLWFTTDKAIEIAQDKIDRLASIAGVALKGAKPKTAAAAVKMLSREEFVALEIPITVQPDEFEGKLRARYDIGWTGEPKGFVQSGFDRFKDQLAERMKEIKGQGVPVYAAAANEQVPVSVYEDADSVYEDDIPF